MFIIKNLTNHDIVLDDLRLILGGNKEIDLDKVAPRYLSENSQKLKLGLRQKKLKVIRKDIDEIVEKTANANKENMLEMEKRIKKEITDQILKVNQKPQSDDKIDQLKGLLEQLINKVNTLPAQVQNQTSPSVETKQNEEVKEKDIDQDVAAKIHAKTVKRLEKQVESHVETKDEKVSQDTSFDDNLRKLEGLL